MSSIIGFCGRCYSGKSELAKVCKDYGYEIMSFGYPLKKLISELLSITIDDINRLKKVDSEYVFKDMDFKFLSKETEIDYSEVKKLMEGKVFRNTREIMQFIGTDLIRNYNCDWHVNKLRSMLETDKNYVFDDVRFPNERAMIEDLGGVCWYVVRPYFDNISNHESETSLKWQEFDNVIVNDKDLGTLLLNWQILMDIGHDASVEERENIMNQLYSNKELINEINNTEDSFVLLDVMFISKYEFTYDSEFLFKRNDITHIEVKDKELYVHFEGYDTRIIKNPLVMEDLKIYM